VSNPYSSLADLRAPGAMIAGKYRVEHVIGRGGMGIVVAAWHVALEQRVAVKLLLADAQLHPEAVTRFLREARAAAKIRSEHVARVIDTGTLEGGAPYMVMEHLTGADLSALLDQRGSLGIDDAVDFIAQACDAIAEAHRHGIIHRDLKPANLFLSARPDGSPVVKVLDFGISKMADDQGPRLTGTIDAMGTALYMSPEQMQQTRTVDLRTDIYALGISLHELLAGAPPFQANTVPLLCVEVLTGEPTPLRTVRPDVPEGLARAIAVAHARDRESRYGSIADFAQALAPYAPRARTTIDRIVRMSGTIVPVAETTPAAPRAHRASTDVIAAPVREAPEHALMGTGRPVVTASTSRTAAPRPVRSRALVAVAMGVLVLSGAGAGLFALSRREAPEPRTAASPVGSAELPTAPSAPAPSIEVVAPLRPQPGTELDAVPFPAASTDAPPGVPSAATTTPRTPEPPARPQPSTGPIPRRPQIDVGF